jgi:hypothetical protein
MFSVMKYNEAGRWSHLLANFSDAQSFTELDSRYFSYTDQVDKAKFNSQRLIQNKIDPRRFQKTAHQALIDSDVCIRAENSFPLLAETQGGERKKYELVFGNLLLSKMGGDGDPLRLNDLYRDSVCAPGLGLKTRNQLVAHALSTLFTRLTTCGNSRGKMQSGKLGRCLNDLEYCLPLHHQSSEGMSWKRSVLMLQVDGPTDLEGLMRKDDKAKLSKVVEIISMIELGVGTIGRVVPLYKRLKAYGTLQQEKAVVAAQNLLLNANTDLVRFV